MVSYFICSVERSGSTLLAALLEGTGVLGKPSAEPFRIRAEVEAFRSHSWTSYDEFIRHVASAGATANGVIGIKLMWRHLARVMSELRRIRPLPVHHDAGLLAEYFPGLFQFVLTQRRDTVAQAVSWSIAYQTDKWRKSHQGNHAEPAYDFRQIYHLHQTVIADSYGWQSWFAANGIEHQEVFYEDWVMDQPGVVSDLSQLIIGDRATRPVTTNLPLRQTTRRNREWRARYTEDLSRYLGTNVPGSLSSESHPWPGL